MNTEIAMNNILENTATTSETVVVEDAASVAFDLNIPTEAKLEYDMSWLNEPPANPPITPEIVEPEVISPVQPLAVMDIPAEYAAGVDNLLKIYPIDPTQESIIRKNFAGFYARLDGMKSRSRAIVVNDETDKDGMADARTLRLEFRNIRIPAEKTRKALKEESIRFGRIVDGAYKLIGDPCDVEEEYLQQQEDFLKNLILKRKAAVKAERATEMEPYVESTAHFNLEDMSEEQFQLLLIGSKATFEQKQEFLAQQANAERLEREAHQRKVDRINILSAIGLAYDGMQYAYGEIGISETAVNILSDDEFDAKVDEINQIVTARKAEREVEIASERRKQSRINNCLVDGMILDGAEYVYPGTGITMCVTDIENLDPDVYDPMFQDVSELITKRKLTDFTERVHLEAIVKKKAAADRKAAATIEAMRIAPDREKLLTFAERIHAVVLDRPDVDDQFENLLNRVSDLLNSAMELLKVEVAK